MNKTKSIYDKKTVIYYIEFIIVYMVASIITLLPLSLVSKVAGWLGRTFCPLSKRMSAITRINLKLVFPDISDDRIADIQRRMFDNLARTFVEYLFVSKFGNAPGFTYEVRNSNYLEQLKGEDKPGIIFTAHYGNWMGGVWYANTIGVPFTPIFRRPHNPFLANYLESIYRNISDDIIDKQKNAGRESLRGLKTGKKLGVLIDQKQRGGSDVAFFGTPAPTSTVMARLAKSFKCPLLPMRVVRKKATHFQIEFSDPITFEDYKDKSDEEVMEMMHHHLENWIKECPEQWMWCYRRWDDSIYESVP